MATGPDGPDHRSISDETLRLAESAVRSDDGTLLPETLLPDTDARRLIERLPRLDLDDDRSALEVGRTLGQGGMGIVRVAEQRSVGREVAVKSLRPELDAPHLVLHLLREAWLTGGLEHPNIVPIHDVGLDGEGRPVIVMKRISGEPWSARIEAKAEDLRWHLGILQQVARAAELAGSRGIVHRDLKPANVMIGAFGEVYVLDWGIAVSLLDDAQGRLPHVRDVRGIAGTPGYMAPEMVRDTGAELGVHTDVYLLGAILHELLTGERRHTGPNLQSVLLSSMASPPFEYPDYIPEELAQIANRASAQSPEARFTDAGAFREAIEDFLAHDSSRVLSDQAEQRMRDWSEASAPDPVFVQEAFFEARFGFQQALEQWSENLAAREGLKACLTRKFEYDLARDDFESASIVAKELSALRPDQEARLEELRARIARRRAELAELRDLQQSRNLDVGRRTRAFLMLLTALSFGAIPPGEAFAQAAGLPADYAYFYAAGAMKVVVGGLLVYWARESLSKTQVNRQLTASLLLLIVTEIAIRPFAQRLGHPIEHALFIDFGIYALVTTTLAITVDPRLAPAPVFYLAGVLLAYQWVGAVRYFLGAAHLLAYGYIAVIWRPDTLLPPRPASSSS